MSQQILFTGIMSDTTEINTLWSDHNNVRHGSKIEIDVEGTDHARMLCIYVNGARVAVVPCSQTTQEIALSIGRLAGGR